MWWIFFLPLVLVVLGVGLKVFFRLIERGEIFSHARDVYVGLLDILSLTEEGKRNELLVLRNRWYSLLLEEHTLHQNMLASLKSFVPKDKTALLSSISFLEQEHE